MIVARAFRSAAALAPRSSAGFHTSASSCAGHSKWAKIARSKGANDAKRGALFSKHANAIGAAARSGDAMRLASAIEKAQRDDCPKHIIERAKDVSAKGEATEEILYEGIGPSSVAVLVEALTTNRNRAAKTIRACFNKYNGDFQSSGSVSWQFTTRGRFTLEYDAADAAVQDKLMEAAMNAGAEDIEFPEDEPAGDEEGAAPKKGAGATAYVFCDPGKLGTVKNALIAAGYKPTVSELLRTANSTVEVPEGEEAEAFSAFLERLEELEDVQAIYHNAA